MTVSELAIHHVTAICGQPQPNLDFYAGTLGMRFVKRTVNFDDPTAYHFYYGDWAGSPGTLVTFFPYLGGRPGITGVGMATSLRIEAPEDAQSFWADRLAAQGVSFGETTLGDAPVFAFEDPDGMMVELVFSGISPAIDPYAATGVAKHRALGAVHSVELSVDNFDATESLLVDTMGFRLIEDQGERRRYQAPQSDRASLIDVRCCPEAQVGRVALGSIHHVAFRVKDAESQLEWRAKLVDLGYHVSPVMNRDYFKSIYFREPGGTLFEFATDGPGMDIDEPIESLGDALRLPKQYEPYRGRIESALPPITIPR